MPQKKTSRKLNKKDTEMCKKLLIALRAELIHDIKNMSDANDSESRDLSGHVQHMADVATDMYEKEFNLGLASHDREVLQKIEEALKRIDDGEYGLCLKGKQLINIERLKAIPYAENCRDCQEKIEEEEGRK